MDEQVMQVVKLPLNQITADEEFNCRGKIIPLDVVDLAKNIQEQGLIQPVVVFPTGPDRYDLVAGFRRYLAHKVNNADTIDCIIRLDLDDAVKRKLFNLSENLNRKDLNMFQEAKAIQPLYLKEGLTQQEIADRLNVSRTWVQIRVYILKLPTEIQKEVENGIITSEHIMALNGLTKAEQLTIVKDIKEKKQSLKDQGKRARVKLTKSMIKKDPSKRMQRDPQAIERMMDHIFDNIGGGPMTRALAWAAGNISSNDLFDDIEIIASEQGKFYVPPQEDI